MTEFVFLADLEICGKSIGWLIGSLKLACHPCVRLNSFEDSSVFDKSTLAKLLSGTALMLDSMWAEESWARGDSGRPFCISAS